MFKIDIIISSVMLRINISKKGTFHGTLFLIIEYDKAIYDNNLLPFPRFLLLDLLLHSIGRDALVG